MTTHWKWLLLGFGWCLIVAPTPGSVGSCGTDVLDEPTDFMSYCQKREELICTRRYLRKEITAETRDACRWDGVDACARRAFPPDCKPTRRQSEACLNALASFDTLNTPEADLPECKQKALCTATPSEQAAMPDAGQETDNP
jgi:hypothetical protein